MHAKNDPASI